MKILLEPTGSFEVFKGVQYRLFKGKTEHGTEVQFLGLFRIVDPMERMKFASQLAQATAEQGQVVTPMLDAGNLLTK